VVAHHQAGRIARFSVGDREALLFGRLDLDDGDSLPIGRLSVLDDAGPLLVDWRAPAAAPFYRATAANPEGVARRRTILVEGPTVVDVMPTSWSMPPRPIGSASRSRPGRVRCSLRSSAHTITACATSSRRSSRSGPHHPRAQRPAR
jgi:hypothetical protein